MRKYFMLKSCSPKGIRTFMFVLIVVVCFIAVSQLLWTQESGSKAGARREASNHQQ